MDEQIRLINLTGTTDPYAPLDDGRSWRGYDRERIVVPPIPAYPPGDRDDTGGR